MKRTVLCFCILVIGLCLHSGCSRCAGKVKSALEENAAIVIEFFPEGANRNPFEKPERIHLNLRYDSTGDTLIIKIDHWHFKGGRNNSLQVLSVPMSKVDPESIEIVPEEMSVGPISYKGGKIDVQPRRILLSTIGKQVRMETYDKGTGPGVAPADSERFRIPKEGAEVTQTDQVEIHAPNEERAQKIVDVINDCL